MASKKKAKVVIDDENPEWTADTFKRATRFPPGTTLVEATKQMVRKRGRPKLDKPKKMVTLRLDEDVLSSYQKDGDGWQTKINEDLRKARKLKKAG